MALNPNGTFAYTLDNSNPTVNALNEGQTLADALTYQISDGHGGTSSATLTVTIRGTFSPEIVGTAVYSKEYGTAPDASELINLIAFTTSHYAYAQQIGVLDPTVAAYEALG